MDSRCINISGLDFREPCVQIDEQPEKNGRSLEHGRYLTSRSPGSYKSGTLPWRLGGGSPAGRLLSTCIRNSAAGWPCFTCSPRPSGCTPQRVDRVDISNYGTLQILDSLHSLRAIRIFRQAHELAPGRRFRTEPFLPLALVESTMRGFVGPLPQLKRAVSGTEAKEGRRCQRSSCVNCALLRSAPSLAPCMASRQL